MFEYHNIRTMPQDFASQSDIYIYYVCYIEDEDGTVLNTVATCYPESVQYTTDVYIADGYVALTASYSDLSLMAVPENEESPEGKLTTYGYDDLGRLISKTTVDNNETDVINYTYDNRGNRATMTKNGTLNLYLRYEQPADGGADGQQCKDVHL